MSEKKTSSEKRAEVFGLDTDPLAQFEEGFVQLEESGEDDPLTEYIETIQQGALDNTDGTVYNYEITFRDWREHMDEMGRHPACPNKTHVLEFIDDELEEGLKPSTVRKKVERVQNAYQWWQGTDDWPHDMSFDPFASAMKERNLTDSEEEHQKKKPPYVPLDEIREVVGNVKHIADRAIIGTQLKFGCRSGELANIRISEIHIDHPNLLEHYETIGTHDMLDGRPNAVYIPHDRAGNKRERSTVLPLDEEARRLLIDWLLVRPDVPDPDHPDDPRLFMTHKGKPLSVSDIRYIWTKHWWPEYEKPEDGQFRSVTPHYARHRFSTYWKNDLTGINREWVKYMRGDKTDTSVGRSHDALDHYVHTFYEDVESLYRNQMFQLYI